MMRNLKFLFTVTLTLMFSVVSIGQTEYSAYTAIGKGVATTFLTDYQCLGINVSALGYGSGFEGKRSTIGTTEFALGMYSPELTKQGLKNTFSDIWAAALNNDNEAFN